MFACVFVGTSKAGLDMLTKVMGLELGPHKVGMQSKLWYTTISRALLVSILLAYDFGTLAICVCPLLP